MKMQTGTPDRNRAQAKKREFGDFQTPDSLAREVCELLANLQTDYASIIEPTCGIGGLLTAAMQCFPNASCIRGFEINRDYVAQANSRIALLDSQADADVEYADFFTVDWQERLEKLQAPLLIVGNPPWVTNAELGRLRSANLPPKSNCEKLTGIEAITGNSNFDICETVIRVLIPTVAKRDCTIAMLCKKSVARRVLQYCWSSEIAIDSAKLFDIDSRKHFAASVDACLFVLEFSEKTEHGKREASCFESLSDAIVSPEIIAGEVRPPIRIEKGQTQISPTKFPSDSENAFAENCVRPSRSERSPRKIGWADDRLIADLESYQRYAVLLGTPPKRWRSGIKHDCTRVMELRRIDGNLVNGFDDQIEIESDYLFAMLKGSQIGAVDFPDRFMIVPQKTVGDSTDVIKTTAPNTWRYLNEHKELLDRRRSRIYQGKPAFSVFGVGPYSFAPYKVAISSLHRSIQFHVVEPHDGKPVMLDDTAYFLPMDSLAEAELVCRAMNSEAIQSLLRSLTFPDAKRTVTAKLLNQCDYSKRL